MTRRLEDLIGELEELRVIGDRDREISALVYDSWRLEAGCLFVCIRGARFDGHSAIPEAIGKGAAALLVETVPEGVEAQAGAAGVTLLIVPDTRAALGRAAAAWFDYPARKLYTIGITGTKGKTTTTYLIQSILRHAGIPCGLIGTIEADDGQRRIPALNTTPESYIVQEYLARMAENGCRAVVMEVSSQALMMHRVEGITYDIGVFMNLSPDHIGPNEHKDLEDYQHCKSLLFRQCKVGIVNGDDAHTEAILQGHRCAEIERFGLREGGDCDYQAEKIRLVREGGALGVRFFLKRRSADGEEPMEIAAPFPGHFSVYNILAALAVCAHRGVTSQQAQEGLRAAHVKGRIEMLPVAEDYTLMIDYAHNAMALESLLTTLRAYEPERVVTLFGCGGNRAKSRRYEMGEVSGRLSDLTIITSDNPRDEEPMEIIQDIVTGIEQTQGAYVTIPDRREAIAYAIHHARRGDVIILAGKGHEDYQEIRGVKHPMDERVLVRDILREDGDTAALERLRARYPELG